MRINFAEGLAVIVHFDYLWSLGTHIRRRSVLWVFTDNIQVENTLNKRYARTRGNAFWCDYLFELCRNREVIIRARRVPSKINKLAEPGRDMHMIHLRGVA